MRNHQAFFTNLLLAITLMPLPAQTLKQRAVYIPYEDAQPILETLNEILPPEIKNRSRAEQVTIWPGWVARRDAEIRARLSQGDEDSLVNLLLFGTSYTKQPRITQQQVTELERAGKTATAGMPTEASPLSRVLQGRVNDFVSALAAPGSNERLLFARRFLVERKSYNLDDPAKRAQIKAAVINALGRMLNEQAGYAKTLEAARSLGNTSEEFAERSRLYRARGLSSDTSLLPNFALEEALKLIQLRGMLSSGSIRRVAVVGPGLDFADKQEGHDFYPQQTIQPFAIIDSLLRLRLTQSDALQVKTFDLSPRVNDHLARSRQRARRGQSYPVQLPRDPRAGWRPEAVRYWERFGDQIGKPVSPIAVPTSAVTLKIRAVSLRPDVVSRVTPFDTNIVLQRLELAPAEKFDLIIATNIFVYYDTLDQSLALLNVERMLRPGGMLLTNNALLELPFSRVRSVGYSTAVYSDRPDDGDHIVWYQRSPE